MKLKINKACDLSSISVLPPHNNRRSNSVQHGPQGSQLQLRSQPSQQSYSQGFSSQYGMFSQLSQSSLDAPTDQRSQERESSAKKISRLPPISNAREESQMQISRTSNNLMCKWNSASGSDHQCQISEEFEHRIGKMENSLSKFGMILDSVQSDAMQVKKGTKEVALEMEAMQQKLMIQDSSLQLMNKGQEVFRASLDAGIKSMSEQLSKHTNYDKLQEIFLALSALPEKMEASLLSSENKLLNLFIKEMQKNNCTIQTCQNQICSIQTLQNQVAPVQTCVSVVSPKALVSTDQPVKHPDFACIHVFSLIFLILLKLQATSPPAIIQEEEKPKKKYVRKYVRKLKVPSLPSPKGAACSVIPRQKPQPIKKASERPKNPALLCHSTVPQILPNFCVQAAVVPKTETGGWKTVKTGKASSTDRVPHKEQKYNGITPNQQERGGRIIIESDEDIDGGLFSCLLDEKDTDVKNYMIEDVDEETERILRRARRRKRRCRNPILIN